MKVKMKLRILAIIFIISGFSGHTFSAIDNSKTIKDMYFPDIAEPGCIFRGEETKDLNILQYMAAVGIDISFDQRKHTKKLLKRRLNMYNSSQEPSEKKGLKRLLRKCC